MLSSAKLTYFSNFWEDFSQEKIGKNWKKKSLGIVLLQNSNLTNFILLFIQGFELLVFRYTNISCKIRSTSSNKMAGVQMYSWMKYRLQTASNGAKENQHHRGWMVFGRCMDRTLFYRWVLVPPANLPMAAGF
jgi:hypothetical protein